MRDARYHRVPAPFDIHFNSLIHGTTYNFDDDPCHNTILMLFQNQSKKPLSQPARATKNQKQARKLEQTLTCQKIITTKKKKKKARRSSN